MADQSAEIEKGRVTAERLYDHLVRRDEIHIVQLQHLPEDFQYSQLLELLETSNTQYKHIESLTFKKMRGKFAGTESKDLGESGGKFPIPTFQVASVGLRSPYMSRKLQDDLLEALGKYGSWQALCKASCEASKLQRAGKAFHKGNSAPSQSLA